MFFDTNPNNAKNPIKVQRPKAGMALVEIDVLLRLYKKSVTLDAPQDVISYLESRLFEQMKKDQDGYEKSQSPEELAHRTIWIDTLNEQIDKQLQERYMTDGIAPNNGSGSDVPTGSYL